MNDYFNEFAKLAIVRGLISEADDSTSRLDPDNIAKTKELYNLKKEKSLKDYSDEAHKETAIVSPSHNKLNGIVPDLYQQQNIDINIVNKKTNGQLGLVKTCQHELATSLVAIANFSDESDDEIRILADTCLIQLKKEAGIWSKLISKFMKSAPKAATKVAPSAAAVRQVAKTTKNPSSGIGISEVADGAMIAGMVGSSVAGGVTAVATAPVWATVAVVGVSLGALLLAGNWLLNRLDEPETNINVTVENIDDLISDMLKVDWSWFEDDLSESFKTRLTSLQSSAHLILDSYNKNYPIIEKIKTLNQSTIDKNAIIEIASAKNELVKAVATAIPEIKSLFKDIKDDSYLQSAIKNPAGIDGLLGRAKEFFSGKMGLFASNYKELEDYLEVLIKNCEGILKIKDVESQLKEKIQGAKEAVSKEVVEDTSDKKIDELTKALSTSASCKKDVSKAQLAAFAKEMNF